jgi:outer membrane protein OmpA-like peptidoglycan-associated protein
MLASRRRFGHLLAMYRASEEVRSLHIPRLTKFWDKGQQISVKKGLVSPGSLIAVVLAAHLGVSAIAQSTPANNSSQTTAPAPTTNSSTSGSASDSSTYATGKPLTNQSNEGFWGKLNPLARKKWVNRQVSPVKDRLNELDQITAKNASDIKDVDSRAQAGIQKAQTTADQANQQAQQASTQAGQAAQTAQQATAQTSQLSTTVSNIDQYQQITDTELHFRSTQTALNDKAKEALDQIATQLQGQKGYIVEVQGYSHMKGQAGIQKSQNMADAVVRYLVVDHHVPVFRIYRLGMGNAPLGESTDSSVSGTVVHVTLMHNSLAALNSPSGGSPIGATQQQQPQPSPRDAASQPHN